MKGDFTRSSFDPAKHFNSVRMQQGRVPLDADWNEAEDIASYLDETTRVDVIGRCGFPQDAAGFEIAVLPAGGLAIGAGRGYVDGILCENDEPVLVTEQSHLPGYELPTADGIYVAYLDVWKRHITALEDPEILEVALGGPDTATRLQTIWQVRLEPVDADEGNPNAPPSCEDFGPDWQPADVQGDSQLRARAEPDPLDDRPCIVPAQAGYRRLENQLYRVEIHRGGGGETATFKWSRDNGSIVTAWTGPDTPNTDTLTVTTVGRDSVLRFEANQWVELKDDTLELNGDPGTLVQLDRAEDQTLEIDGTASRADFPRLPKVRRWDHQATATVSLVEGAVPVTEGTWLPLEDGVEIWFEPGGTYHTGDYWLIPARTIGADVLWPRDTSGDPQLEAPQGIAHHYCSLALLQLTDGVWEPLQDCRPDFPPLTELPEGSGCCTRVAPGEDVQRAIDRAIAAGGGCLCLGHGVHTVSGPLRLTNAHNLHISGESAVTTLRLMGNDGAGLGGLLLQNARQVSLDRLLVIGQNVDAAITLRHGDIPNEDVTLRRLSVINLTPQAQSLFPACALHLVAADRLHVDDCRLIASVSVLSLLGEQLPTVPDTDATPPIAVAAPTLAQILTFENLALGTRFQVGDSLPLTGVIATAQRFTWSNGETTDGGFAQVEAGGRAGGTGQELELNNINLNLAFATSQPQVTIQFGEYGGNINLTLNGELRNTGNFAALSGETIGGVTVTVDQSDGPIGRLICTGEINQLAIGGQELWIDTIQFASEPIPELPSPRLQAVSLTASTLLFTRYGIWALAAQAWRLVDCELRPLPRITSQTGSTNSREREPNLTARVDLDLEAIPDSLRDSQQLLEQISLARSTPSSLARGVAIKALLWQDCQILSSRLEGERAVEIAGWIKGSACHNQVTSRTAGFYGFWLQTLRWEGNHLQCEAGAALSWVGCHRAKILHNRVWHSQLGLSTVASDRGFAELATSLRDIRSVYTTDADAEPIVLWQLLTALVPVWQIDAVLAPLQILFDQVNVSLPALYWLSRVWLYPWLSTPESMPALFRQLVSALIALQIEHNDIEAEEGCVQGQGFWTLGGIVIRDNRLHTTSGQALLLNATPGTINVYLLILFWRFVGRALQQSIEGLVSELQSRLPDATPDQQPLLTALIFLLQAVNEQLQTWQQASEGFLEADNRIEGNRIRSLDTAISINLFEIALLNNAITLQERPTTLSNLTVVVNALSVSPAFGPWAIALKDGSRGELNAALQDLQADPDAFATADSRSLAVAALSNLSSGVGGSDPMLQQAATTLILAFNEGAPLGGALAALAQALTPYLGSYGILFQGIGGRIVGNQIAAPVDLNTDSWSRGGLRLAVDLQFLLFFVGIAIALQQSLLADDDQDDDAGLLKLDPLLGVTETLIDNNEILGGIGHGIEIQGSRDVPEALFKLKLRGNEIGGMGGAGIFIHETALVVNLDIEGNRIADCATQPDLLALSAARAGLDISGAIFCRLHNNRVNGCGIADNVQQTPFAVNLESLFDLVFTDNSVQYNPTGGVRFINVFGTVSVNDNDISQNQGIGFLWENADFETLSSADRFTAGRSLSRQAIAPEVAFNRFTTLVNQPPPAQLTEVQAAIEGNQFHVPAGVSAVAWQLTQLRDLLLTGNLASHSVDSAIGTLEDIENGVITNNRLRYPPGTVPPAQAAALHIRRMQAGTVVGNHSPLRFPIELAQSPNVVEGLNSPPVRVIS